MTPLEATDKPPETTKVPPRLTMLLDAIVTFPLTVAEPIKLETILLPKPRFPLISKKPFEINVEFDAMLKFVVETFSLP